MQIMVMYLLGILRKESTKNKNPKGFDILCAGFPCQAFSLAGKRLGFEETRGTLFFDVAEYSAGISLKHSS